MVYELIDLRYQKEDNTLEQILKRLKSFKLKPKFLMGIWYVTLGGGRFYEGYVPNKTIEEKTNIIKNLAKVRMTIIKAHFPDKINWNNIDLYLDLKKSTSIKME
ncbi:MAG: hypothetical protein EAX96_07160 [Candidatus Lokiarchaeota archaeon]|nr:hypothetical protein [Candidatus Lokiarchaeota archaeon]